MSLEIVGDAVAAAPGDERLVKIRVRTASITPGPAGPGVDLGEFGMLGPQLYEIHGALTASTGGPFRSGGQLQRPAPNTLTDVLIARIPVTPGYLAGILSPRTRDGQWLLEISEVPTVFDRVREAVIETPARGARELLGESRDLARDVAETAGEAAGDVAAGAGAGLAIFGGAQLVLGLAALGALYYFYTKQGG